MRACVQLACVLMLAEFLRTFSPAIPTLSGGVDAFQTGMALTPDHLVTAIMKRAETPTLSQIFACLVLTLLEIDGENQPTNCGRPDMNCKVETAELEGGFADVQLHLLPVDERTVSEVLRLYFMKLFF